MYWEERGPQNTDATIELALKRAEELGIKYIVVASNTGATARKLLGRGREIICVTHHVGFAEPGVDEMEAATRQELQEQGVKILTTTHLLAGVDRSLRFKFQGAYPAEIIASRPENAGPGAQGGRGDQRHGPGCRAYSLRRRDHRPGRQRKRSRYRRGHPPRPLPLLLRYRGQGNNLHAPQ